ncbi:hypothetical protein BR93DRAFT_272294 [Coniochaeta sp. PMI_546]|nr:hypothetical protein BR93DRAFT_272294 [Coniochaeta sp. PMI_546]
MGCIACCTVTRRLEYGLTSMSWAWTSCRRWKRGGRDGASFTGFCFSTGNRYITASILIIVFWGPMTVFFIDLTLFQYHESVLSSIVVGCRDVFICSSVSHTGRPHAKPLNKRPQISGVS